MSVMGDSDTVSVIDSENLSDMADSETTTDCDDEFAHISTREVWSPDRPAVETHFSDTDTESEPEWDNTNDAQKVQRAEFEARAAQRYQMHRCAYYLRRYGPLVEDPHTMYGQGRGYRLRYAPPNVFYNMESPRFRQREVLEYYYPRQPPRTSKCDTHDVYVYLPQSVSHFSSIQAIPPSHLSSEGTPYPRGLLPSSRRRIAHLQDLSGTERGPGVRRWLLRCL